MTANQVIPAAAIWAARRVAYERYGSKPDAAYLRTILEAAAPHMLALAWEWGEAAGQDNAAAYQTGGPVAYNPYRSEP